MRGKYLTSTKPTKMMERKWVVVGKTGGPIITFGSDPGKALDRARRRGYDDPIIFFLPKATDACMGGSYYERDANGLLRSIGD